MAGALEARQIPAGETELYSEAEGRIVKENNVLVLKSIHVTYHLKADPQKQETAERVHGFHVDYCPVAISIRGSIAVTTALQIQTAD